MSASFVLRNAEEKIGVLVHALKMHDEDTLSEMPVKEAYSAMQSIINVLQEPQPTGAEWTNRKRRVLGIIDPLMNSAILIALGNMRKPFEETIEGVKVAIQKVELDKVKGTQFDPRGQAGT